MSCQHAVILGKYAGENAARDLLGMRLLEYSQPRYVTCLDLGCSGAVFSEGWERVPVLTGDRATAIKTDIKHARFIHQPVTATKSWPPHKSDDVLCGRPLRTG